MWTDRHDEANCRFLAVLRMLLKTVRLHPTYTDWSVPLAVTIIKNFQPLTYELPSGTAKHCSMFWCKFGMFLGSSSAVTCLRISYVNSLALLSSQRVPCFCGTPTNLVPPWGKKRDICNSTAHVLEGCEVEACATANWSKGTVFFQLINLAVLLRLVSRTFLMQLEQPTAVKHCILDNALKQEKKNSRQTSDQFIFQTSDQFIFQSMLDSQLPQRVMTSTTRHFKAESLQYTGCCNVRNLCSLSAYRLLTLNSDYFLRQH